ncbi:ligase-associated DNA damage response exonuclease [Sphingobacterium bovistauri]|uniref:Ligase-associated DNA damage response exonuclease n=1 Tax=Sphingobacterium bovistauri TaxID=2781959 RepID=A0ABS7Z2A1_9SPHI|nr:ligase-associated DNA damage response exonuclease [Sphingobacterium bovistauri]MCA5003687.1 ligase-associated DNA damage response exonuclease [Sphingobacterium bovistauri]
MRLIQFRPEGIYCVPGKFFIDPWLPVDIALITHGHADHARWGMKKYLCHHFTVPILRSRISPDIQVQGISYDENIKVNDVQVSFHPAGHIIGSAQIRLEYKGRIVVISGDYKLQNDGLSTPFDPVKCHEYVSESTFGLPIYQWKSVERQNEELANWVVHNQSYHKTSVFVGYSLGKAQRIMKAVEDTGPLYVHYSIHKLNQAYESVGIKLPKYEVLDFREDVKHVNQGIVIVPPALVDSNAIRKIPNMAYAICSGWMTVRGARRWRSADAGFAISDHADWNDLLTAIKLSEAEKVYVTHGQTAVFSKYLNEIGIASEEVKTEFGEEDDEIVSAKVEGNVV